MTEVAKGKKGGVFFFFFFSPYGKLSYFFRLLVDKSLFLILNLFFILKSVISLLYLLIPLLPLIRYALKSNPKIKVGLGLMSWTAATLSCHLRLRMKKCQQVAEPLIFDKLVEDSC